MKLVDIYTGRVFEPAYTKETSLGMRWWTGSELKKDGTPSLRNTGHWLGQFYALYDPAREARTAPIRQQMERAKASLKAADEALKAIYED